MFSFYLVFAMSLCASVYMCFVVTCWERADLLALVCGVYCEFVTFPLVSWVRCGSWLYRFLIFAPLLTLISPILLRKGADNIALPYSIIFNRSLGQGYFPNSWKEANVASFYKNDDTCHCQVTPDRYLS